MSCRWWWRNVAALILVLSGVTLCLELKWAVTCRLWRVFYSGLTLWHMLCTASMSDPSHHPPLLLFTLWVLPYAEFPLVLKVATVFLWSTSVGRATLFPAAHPWICRGEGRGKKSVLHCMKWKKSFYRIWYKFNFFFSTSPFGACLRESEPGNGISLCRHGRYIWCNRGSMTGLYYSK